MSYFVGVDVGSSSVRAGLFNDKGGLKVTAVRPIKMFEVQVAFYEQSSEDIWENCVCCIRTVCDKIQDKSSIKGIGFDATCSLVVLNDNLKPVSVSPSGSPEWNIVMWMDHRAESEAAIINATQHQQLQYVGGAVSLEMQMPKLLWLKNHLKEQCWDRVGHLMDLPDFLTWRATGSLSRSLCSLVCKWNYRCSADGQMGWQEDFLQAIGLPELVEDNFSKIGREVLQPGRACGQGLSERSAAQLGLLAGTPVSTSLLDAHTGGLGSLACRIEAAEEDEFQHLSSVPVQQKLALISGTSACHLIASEKPLFVPGVWGPYYSAMVPGMWCNEAGQSAAGKLVDHVVESHAAFPWVAEEAKSKGEHIHETLNKILEYMANKSNCLLSELTRNFHVYPDFHGNRSPLADPSLCGMISGMTLAAGAESLALLYLATIQSLAYSSRQIIESLTKAGHEVKVIHICGGLSKNMLYVRAHSEATGLPVVIPNQSEPVLLGGALLGASAAGHFSSIQEAMTQMGGGGRLIVPEKQMQRFHNNKYEVFLQLQKNQLTYRQIMSK